MKVNLGIVEKLAGFELPGVDELVARVNSRLGGVEQVINIGQKYKGARIVRVVECAKHPDADRLSVVKIDDGGIVEGVGRDENGLVQVVCGAPNVRADMWAVWLPPNSSVPSSFDDEEPFVLSARPLRGVLSQGMLAAGDELALNDDHDGIVEVTAGDLPSGVELAPGLNFAEIFGLDGYVIDIENKMFTHRPDCFGQLGVAREISGIFGQKFESPSWYGLGKEFLAADSLTLDVANEAPELVSRFMAVVLEDIKVESSPLWLQCQLVAMGARPINNVVDATNYVMLMTAQPVHAYDYDKLSGAKLVSRLARPGEKLSLLSGKEIELTADDIVIADAEKPLGLAGIMGGSNSEVSTGTTRVVLEVANFDMYALRKTAMRHGVFTDALARFNKGQSPLQTAPVLHYLMQLIGAKQASSVCDVVSEGVTTRRVVGVSGDFIRDRLGADIAVDEMRQLLANVEIPAGGDGEFMSVEVPFWRTDIEIYEDVVEEVGRLYGFDRLPRELPKRTASPAARSEENVLLKRVRNILVHAGANEALTYSFVHERVLKSAGQDPAQAYKITNALSPDLQYYRLSLTPNLLDKIHGNVKSGHDEFALFEIGKSHSKKAAPDIDGLPVEPKRVAFVYTAKKPGKGAPYFRAKRFLEFLGDKLGLNLDYKPLASGSTLAVAAPFAGGRAARVIDQVSGMTIGIVGEYNLGTRKDFKLPEYTAGFELFVEGLVLATRQEKTRYKPLRRLPLVERDICYRVDGAVSYADIVSVAKEALLSVEIDGDVQPVDFYQAEGDSKKHVTVRIRLIPESETLTSKVANKLIEEISQKVIDATSATIV